MRTLLAGVGRLFSSEEETADNVEVLLEGGRIVAIGPQHTLAADQEVETYPCQGALLTAGLVDAHTHPIYLRPRLEEIAERSAGASYTDIAARGGGIGATVRETRRASWDDLEQALRRRLRRWLEDGTTTVEAKTGYWLERSGELRALELLARLRDDPRLPHLVATFLGAHALPEEFLGRRQEYVDEVARWYPAAKEVGASFADVFCDRGAFTVAETAELMGAAREAGLSHRVHADELALTGATQLAVEQNAASADHLLRIGPEEIGLLASSSTVATLCPVTALALGQPPPARALVAAGVPLALGTDHNPGTS
ncbi:MAG TPA: imidazolonepropionase, partial [Candidatus Dormibacteraeota bacterium]